MPIMKIITDGTKDPCDIPLNVKSMIHSQSPFTVVGMPAGMQNGEPSVIFRIPMPDGRECVAESSLKLFVLTARALETYYKTHHGWKTEWK